jgi:HSP20 family molecular chaperone IbpA
MEITQVPRATRPTRLSSEDSPTHSAFDAEKEARDRIAIAHRAADEAERESALRLDQARDQFNEQSEAQNARNAANYEDQQMRGYQAVRELQQRQQAELARLRREGEKELEETKLHFKGELARTERDATSALEAATRQHYQQFVSEDQRSKNEAELSKKERETQLKAEQELHDLRLSQVRTKNEQEYSKLQSATEGEQQTLGGHFGERLNALKDEYDSTLERVQNLSREKLYDFQHANQTKLSAYQSRMSDPFYAIRTLNGDLTETDGAYILRAEVPEHEASQISASVHGHQLVISGTRRNAETVREEPGREVATHSFQSFRETYPILESVDAKSLTKFYEDGVLTVILPKITNKTSYAELNAPIHRRDEESLKKKLVDRPQYPRTLQVTQADQNKSTEELGPPPAPAPARGSSKIMGAEG